MKQAIATLQPQVPEAPRRHPHNHPPPSPMNAEARKDPPPTLQNSSKPWTRRKRHRLEHPPR
jgi:hypothetical protein